MLALSTFCKKQQRERERDAREQKRDRARSGVHGVHEGGGGGLLANT